MPTSTDFGYATLKQAGRPAIGGRRLLIILGEYSNFSPYSTNHPVNYYELLGFGTPTPPFSTSDPINPASLSDYFLENSNGRFWFDRVAVVGPIALGVYANDPGPEARSAGILQKVADQSPHLFADSDVDMNSTVGVDELCVLLFENIANLLPANRDNNPIQVNVPMAGFTTQVTVGVHVAGAGPVTPFYQIAHELSHSLGTIDMYNTGAGNFLLTLMGGYPFFTDDQVTVHFDIWHKFVLGWAEPRMHLLSTPDPPHISSSADVHEGPDGALLLWDHAHETREFFMIERRRSNSPTRKYDAGFNGDGVLIWRIRPGMPTEVAHLGAPDFQVGGSGVWTAGQQTPLLRWSDGSSTGVHIALSSNPDGSIKVTWGDELIHVSTSRHLRLFHGGNGTTPVDSGLPMQGIFYGVTTDGNLEWNRYNGRGEQVGDPASMQSWAPNTGNPIGRGFNGLVHVFACGDGIIMAVLPNGDLRWFMYNGNGESDVTGTLGWLPNSGNTIGNGWQGFKQIFVFPQAGHSTNNLKLFGVAQNGDLLWYSYNGNGEHDPSGSTGWHQNSGNTVGNGWQNFRHIHGSGNVVFAVQENGDLLWYSYSGRGEHDPSGTSGWHSNSGNPIGNGWQGMQHIFGGTTDLGGFGHVVMGVDANGDLRWYKYTGNGESDRSGVLGWDPRSGTIIGHNW